MRFGRYIENWVRARSSWFWVLTHHALLPSFDSEAPLDLRALRLQEWRDYLNMGEECEADMASKTTLSADRKRAIFAFFQKAFGTDLLFDRSVVLEWFGSLWSPDSVEQTRQIMWELSEVEFRYELLALDCHFVSYADKVEQRPMLEGLRRAMIQSIFADRPPILTALPTENVGLAAADILKRAASLEALRQLMSRWPSVPDSIKNVQALTEMDSSALSRAEALICKYYVQTFWETAGRAATIPRLFPTP